MEPTVEPLQEATDEAAEAFGRLLPQLSISAPPLTRARLADLVASPASTVLMARHAGRYVGTLTLLVIPIPTGTRAWIEDVVVDESARGLGVGELLTRRALEVARELGVRTVDLTSRPTRAAANRLYERVGFVRRDTNVYRHDGAAGPVTG